MKPQLAQSQQYLDQLGGILEGIKRSNPQRHGQIMQHLNQVQAKKEIENVDSEKK